MAKLQGFHSEMKNTGILTVQQICDVHGVLMGGLRADAGNVLAYTCKLMRVGTIKDLQPTAPVLKAGHPGVLYSLCYMYTYRGLWP